MLNGDRHFPISTVVMDCKHVNKINNKWKEKKKESKGNSVILERQCRH